MRTGEALRLIHELRCAAEDYDLALSRLTDAALHQRDALTRGVVLAEHPTKLMEKAAAVKAAGIIVRNLEIKCQDAGIDPQPFLAISVHTN